MTDVDWWSQVAPQWSVPEPTAQVTITLGGIDIHGNHRRGAHFGLTGWDGWTGASGTKGGPTAHEFADGGVPSPVLMAGRMIRLEGVIEASSQAEMWQMAETLGAVLTRPREDWLVVDEELLGLSRQVWVSRSGPVQVTHDAPRSALWTVDLVAADWRRVDVTQSTLIRSPGQSGTLANAGNVEADLAAVLTGPLTNPSITVTGQGAWTYTGTIASGQTIGVDFANRLVRDTANGILLRRSASGVWPKVLPGSTSVTVGGSGTGTVDLRWRSSWS